MVGFIGNFYEINVRPNFQTAHEIAVIWDMIQVSQLFIYPIKSLGGIEMTSATLTDRGFEYDRRWMLVDDDNKFLTQREHPVMSLLQPEVTDNGIRVVHKRDPGKNIVIPFSTEVQDKIMVNVWDDWCEAIPAADSINKWFSDQLQMSCRLMYMPGNTRRKVDGQYRVHDNDITAFSDGYPLLMISQASLNDLNSRMDAPLRMNRFRPNIVLSGAFPYQEDEMEEFMIGDIHFNGVKLSARCVMTTIDQDSSERGKEPLRTLNRYRMMNNKAYFGQNVIHDRVGKVTVGDSVHIISRKPLPTFHDSVSNG